MADFGTFDPNAITTPEDTNEFGSFDEEKANQPSEPSPYATGTQSRVRGLVQGLSVEFSDEAQGLVEGTLNWITKSPESFSLEILKKYKDDPEGLKKLTGSWVEQYTAARNAERERNRIAYEANPKNYTASEIVGSIAPMYLTGGMAAAPLIQGVAPSLAKIASLSARQGAAYGAAQSFGAGESTTIPGGFAELGVGGTVGGVSGAGAAVVPAWLGKATNWVTKDIDPQWGAAGSEVGNTLKKWMSTGLGGLKKIANNLDLERAGVPKLADLKKIGEPEDIGKMAESLRSKPTLVKWNENKVAEEGFKIPSERGAPTLADQGINPEVPIQSPFTPNSAIKQRIENNFKLIKRDIEDIRGVMDQALDGVSKGVYPDSEPLPETYSWNEHSNMGEVFKDNTKVFSSSPEAGILDKTGADGEVIEGTLTKLLKPAPEGGIDERKVLDKEYVASVLRNLEEATPQNWRKALQAESDYVDSILYPTTKSSVLATRSPAGDETLMRVKDMVNKEEDILSDYLLGTYGSDYELISNPFTKEGEIATWSRLTSDYEYEPISNTFTEEVAAATRRRLFTEHKNMMQLQRQEEYRKMFEPSDRLISSLFPTVPSLLTRAGAGGVIGGIVGYKTGGVEGAFVGGMTGMLLGPGTARRFGSPLLRKMSNLPQLPHNTIYLLNKAAVKGNATLAVVSNTLLQHDPKYKAWVEGMNRIIQEEKGTQVIPSGASQDISLRTNIEGAPGQNPNDTINQREERDRNIRFQPPGSMNPYKSLPVNPGPNPRYTPYRERNLASNTPPAVR